MDHGADQPTWSFTYRPGNPSIPALGLLILRFDLRLLGGRITRWIEKSLRRPVDAKLVDGRVGRVFCDGSTAQSTWLMDQRWWRRWNNRWRRWNDWTGLPTGRGWDFRRIRIVCTRQLLRIPSKTNETPTRPPIRLSGLYTFCGPSFFGWVNKNTLGVSRERLGRTPRVLSI